MGKIHETTEIFPTEPLSQSRKKKKNTKYCCFCRIHGSMVKESGHKNCARKNCKCKKCTANRRKIETAKKHREKKAKKAQLLNSHVEASKLPVSYCSPLVDSIQNLRQDFQNEAEIPNQNPSVAYLKDLFTPKNGLSGVLYPPISSNSIVTEEMLNFFRNSIDDKVEQETEGTPRFSGDWLESGYWRINFVDFWTLIWFTKVTSTWTFDEQPFEFRLTSDIPTFKFYTHIPGRLVDNDKILQRLFKMNGMDTSKWRILDKRVVLRGFEVDFELDLLSAYNLRQQNYKLYFGMNQIDFGLIEMIDDEQNS